MTCTNQWRIETAQQLEILRLENMALRKQLGENTQLVRALEERINALYATRATKASKRL